LKPLTRETIAAAIKARQDAKGRPAFTVTMGAAGQAAPVTATLTDTLTGDVNTNGQPDPGDTLTYTATIAANGPLSTDATGVNYTAALDPNTTLVPGSLRATPASVNDAYTANQNTPLTQPAGTGVLANDFAGLPAATVTGFQNPTPNGGAVAVAPNGSFTYSPATGYTGPDTFTYTITNAAGTSTATVAIDVRLPPTAVADNFNATKDTPLVVAVPGVLANDTGFPAPTVTPGTVGTSNGGSVTIAADGSFTYTPPVGFVSPPADQFTYLISNVAGNSTGNGFITVDASPLVVASSPAQNAEQVALDANLSITFGEPVTVSATAFTLACPPAGGTIPVTNLTAGPATTFVLDPASLLPAGMPCQITVVCDGDQ
jgi:uncharacterized repeat protein (TIGR01451 family)